MPARNGNGPPKWAIRTLLSPGEGRSQQVLEITIELYTKPETDTSNLINMALTPLQTSAITSTISPVRLGTYLAATGFSPEATALDIYVWNALLSGAFFSSLHICEVAIRNGIACALELKYGANWPWHPGFEQTLPADRKRDLQQARQRIPVGSTGKVIAELKFYFWCTMFTVRHDPHVWDKHLRTAFPFIPYPLTIKAARTQLYEDMESLRAFRNRVAHHEPIFTYPLAELHGRISRLVKMRCGETAEWLAQWEVVTVALAAKP